METISSGETPTLFTEYELYAHNYVSVRVCASSTVSSQDPEHGRRNQRNTNVPSGEHSDRRGLKVVVG